MRLAWLMMGVCGLVALGWSATPVSAEDPPATANRSVLNSVQFRETLREYDEWSLVQKMYTPQQVKKYRAQIIEKASSLTGDELEDFLEDLNEKLRILASAEAREARKWLSQTLAVASDAYAEKLKAKYPNLSEMSAGQLQERLDEFSDERVTARRTSQDFATARKAQVEMVKEERERQAQASASARSAASYSGYHPGGFSTGGSQGPVVIERYRPSYPMFWGGFRW